jgi:hypothetical protein
MFAASWVIIRSLDFPLIIPLMDTQAIAAAIQAEITRLQSALTILTGDTPIKRRGRPKGSKNTPPNWVTATGLAATAPEKPARKKRKFTAAQRKAAAKRMKAMWAAKKKAGKTSLA